jgi:16S rRNA (cytosine967-C5)-methyltransferase
VAGRRQPRNLTRSSQGAETRQVALRALARIDNDGAYANLVLGPVLERSGLDERDRHFVTELVYGTTRMRRACDFVVDGYLLRPVEPDVRAALRLGAYQLTFAKVPPHAAVSATVASAPRRARGLVNAVLRRVADAPQPSWPDLPTELSYPDWIVARLDDDLGATDAHAALRKMNEPPSVTVRADGYVQDLASQWVAASVDARTSMRVTDVCAAPGGKATAIAATGAMVTAGDVDGDRVRLIPRDGVRVFTGDATAPPLRRRAFDRVLVDAPCSGLGVLRRRADARWRIDPDAVERLSTLQRAIVDAAVPLLAPGAMLIYSVCTLTAAETRAVDDHIAAAHPDLTAIDDPPPGEGWRHHSRGWLLLPQDADTDGMYVLRLTAPE